MIKEEKMIEIPFGKSPLKFMEFFKNLCEDCNNKNFIDCTLNEVWTGYENWECVLEYQREETPKEIAEREAEERKTKEKQQADARIKEKALKEKREAEISKLRKKLALLESGEDVLDRGN